MRFILPLSLLACGEAPPSASVGTHHSAEVSPGGEMRNTPAQEPDLSTELAPDLGLSAPSNPTILNAHWNAHESATAENGQGAQVHSQHPIAIDIESRGWRGRALDPVLYIDERRFHQYSHPGPGLIRYVIADLSWVLDATRIGIQYGDDTQSWLTIPLPILEAP